MYDVSELISSWEKNKNSLRLLPYAKPRVVVQLTLTKIIKIVANRWRTLWLKCTKFDFGCRGAYSAPRPPIWIWGLLLREAKGEGGEGREGRGAFPLFLFYETTTAFNFQFEQDFWGKIFSKFTQWIMLHTSQLMAIFLLFPWPYVSMVKKFCPFGPSRMTTLNLPRNAMLAPPLSSHGCPSVPS